MHNFLSRALKRIQAHKPELTLGSLLVLSAMLFVWAGYHARFRLNPDGVSYISIASQYASGYFATAINDLYPPLISWLMAPLIKLGLSGQAAFMSVNVAAATSTLLAGMYLVWRQTKRNFGATVFYWLIVSPLLIYAIGAVITPDLLVVLWASLFLLTAVKAGEWLHQGGAARSLQAGVALGVLGALGYYTKQFLLPFFIVAFVAWALWHLLSFRPKKALGSRRIWDYIKLPLIGLLTMSLLIAPWIVALSVKNHKFTVSTAFSHNLTSQFEDPSNVVSPARTNNSPALVPPPHEHAVAHNECPRCDVPEVRKVNVKGAKGLRYYLFDRFRILPLYLSKINSIWLFVVPIIFIWALAWVSKRLNRRQDYAMIVAGIFWLVYSAGYMAVISRGYDRVKQVYYGGGNARYYWPLFVLAAMIACLALPRFWGWLKKQNRPKKIIATAVLLLLPAAVIVQHWPALVAVPRSASRPTMQSVAGQLKRAGIISSGDRLAGNIRVPTLYLAYYLGAQTYGSIAVDGSDGPKFAEPITQKALRQFGIDYYIHYARPYDPPLELGASKAVIVKVIRVRSLGCTNRRSTGSEPCIISVVKLR